MKKEEFDNYKFSINTEVVVLSDKWGEVWEKITEINFGDRTIAIERGQIYKYNEIIRIKN